MAEKRFALLVANSDYQDPQFRQLRAPAQDAAGLKRVLEDPVIGGFSVQMLLNQPASRVSEAIEDFFSDRQRDDLLLFYFSGHGAKAENGRLYFALTNTNRQRLNSTAIPASLVNELMSASRSRRQVMILDCCYSGAFAKGMVAKADPSLGLKEQLEGSGRVILTSSDALQYAFEGQDLVDYGQQGSVFTQLLIQGLETGQADLNRDGRVTPDELYDYASRHIHALQPAQTPKRWWLEAEGEIFLARYPRPEAALPAWIEAALGEDDPSARLAVIPRLERLAEGEDLPLAELARSTLRKLCEHDPSATVRGAASGALGLAAPLAAPAGPGQVAYTPPAALDAWEPFAARPAPLPLAVSWWLAPRDPYLEPGRPVEWSVNLTNAGEHSLHQVTARIGDQPLDSLSELRPGQSTEWTVARNYRTPGKKTLKVQVAAAGPDGSPNAWSLEGQAEILPAEARPPAAQPAPLTPLPAQPESLDRAGIKAYARAGKGQALTCPFCRVNISAENLLKHCDKLHAADMAAQEPASLPKETAKTASETPASTPVFFVPKEGEKVSFRGARFAKPLQASQPSSDKTAATPNEQDPASQPKKEPQSGQPYTFAEAQATLSEYIHRYSWETRIRCPLCSEAMKARELTLHFNRQHAPTWETANPRGSSQALRQALAAPQEQGLASYKQPRASQTAPAQKTATPKEQSPAASRQKEPQSSQAASFKKTTAPAAHFLLSQPYTFAEAQSVLSRIVRSHQLDATLPCPLCSRQMKARELTEHFNRLHAPDWEKGDTLNKSRRLHAALLATPRKT